jgi:hypothetical protein
VAKEDKEQSGTRLGRLTVAALCTLLLSACISGSGRQEGVAGAVFYQPLNRDQGVSLLQWRILLAETQELGLNTLYIQWNQYGGADFGGHKGWLSQRIDVAANMGMSIWLGLYSDPNYFSQIQGSRLEQASYLEQYFSRLEMSLLQHPLWLNNRRKLQGVYIPIELSDYDYDTALKRAQVSEKLAEFSQLSNIPVAISMYLTGKTPVADIRAWIDLLDMSNIKVLLQDGRGTQLMSDERWNGVEKEMGCNVAVIKEVFQQNDVEPFTASRLTKEAFEAKISQRGCHEQILFSLRYLPLDSQILSLED